MDRRLVSTRFPYVPVTVTVGGWTATIEALLDTGFDGDMSVPRRLATSIGVPHHYGEFIMANGVEAYRPVFLGSGEIGSFGSFPIEVAALGGDYLLGLGLANRFAITLGHGRQIIVEP
jgi:predicted aspartyl protease